MRTKGQPISRIEYLRSVRERHNRVPLFERVILGIADYVGRTFFPQYQPLPEPCASSYAEWERSLPK